jgi:hypothetical protein
MTLTPIWRFWLVFGVLALSCAVVAAGALIVAFYAFVMPPERVRDVDRASALAAIAADLHHRYGLERRSALPDRLPLPASYGYRNLGHGNYQLCATFERERPGGTGMWSHAKGRNCFRFSVYDRPWADPKQRSWFSIAC